MHGFRSKLQVLPDNNKRVAYSPKEFADLFGRSQTWGYRQIYGGKVVAITDHGRILIPAKEVERILESAGIYNGSEKPKQQKARLKELSSPQQIVLRKFLEVQRTPLAAKPYRRNEQQKVAPGSKTRKAASRQAILENVTKRWRKHA